MVEPTRHPLASITLEVLPEGNVRLSSTCLGRFDSSYAPMPDLRAATEVLKLLWELRGRLVTGSPVSPPEAGVDDLPLRGGLAGFDADADVAQAAVGRDTLDTQDALLSAIEARLTKEVRGLVAALHQFGCRTQLIGKDIPDSAKFCKLVAGSLTLLGFQFAYAFSQGLEKPIFFDDGAKYLAGLGLSLEEFVREVTLDGRRFMAVALIEPEFSKLDSTVDAGDEQ